MWFKKNLQRTTLSHPLTEKLRATLDKGGISAALLTDFAKAFDCLPHHLSFVKLHTCGIE